MLRAVRDAQGSITVTQGGRQHVYLLLYIPARAKLPWVNSRVGGQCALCCQGQAGCYSYSSGGFWKENGLGASLTLAL